MPVEPDYLRRVAADLRSATPDSKSGFVTMWPSSRDALAGDLENAADELAKHRSTSTEEVERLRTEIEDLKQRGAQAVIAYHTAICCPKGVVPVDDLYDPVIAARIEAEMDRARTALGATSHVE